MVYQDLLQTIGNTPLVKIRKINTHGVEIFAKLEGVNPGGSVKDRVAKYLIEDAEKKGIITSKNIILEATSGNTGIGLAMIAAVKGYKFTAVVNENVSLEKLKLLKYYGAKIILSKGSGGTNAAIKKAQIILQRKKDYIMLDQFGNLENTRAHYETTGEEIINDMPNVTHFIAGMGTGGTLMGVGKRLKEFNSKINIVGVEPGEDQDIPGLRNMKAYSPPIYNENMLDQKIQIVAKKAKEAVKNLFYEEGISAGVSSGAAMWAALEIAKVLKKGKIVVLFPDRGDRYLH